MQEFDKVNQVAIHDATKDYFAYTLDRGSDFIKASLNLPIAVPIYSLRYTVEGVTRELNVYPTLQFLYSHYIDGTYITTDVRRQIKAFLELSGPECSEEEAGRKATDQFVAQTAPELKPDSMVELHGLKTDKVCSGVACGGEAGGGDRRWCEWCAAPMTQ